MKEIILDREKIEKEYEKYFSSNLNTNFYKAMPEPEIRVEYKNGGDASQNPKRGWYLKNG